jgi:hypothetical protein
VAVFLLFIARPNAARCERHKSNRARRFAAGGKGRARPARTSARAARDSASTNSPNKSLCFRPPSHPFLPFQSKPQPSKNPKAQRAATAGHQNTANFSADQSQYKLTAYLLGTALTRQCAKNPKAQRADSAPAQGKRRRSAALGSSPTPTSALKGRFNPLRKTSTLSPSKHHAKIPKAQRAQPAGHEKPRTFSHDRRKYKLTTNYCELHRRHTAPKSNPVTSFSVQNSGS